MVSAPEKYEGIDADADKELLRKAEHGQVLKAMELLSDSHRTVVKLFHIEGYSCREIAESRGVAIGTVKSRLARAMIALRAELLDSEEVT